MAIGEGVQGDARVAAARPLPRGQLGDALFFAGFALAVAVFVAMAVTSYRAFERFSAINADVDHAHRVIANLDSLLEAVGDLESRQRAYLLSEEPAFLLPYSDRMASVAELLKSLEQRIPEGAPLRARLPELRRRVDAKMAGLLTVALDQSGGRRELLEASARSMDEIRAVVLEMRAEEERLLNGRVATVQAATVGNRQVILFGNAAGMLLLLLAGLMFLRNARARQLLEREREQHATDLASAILAAESANEAKSAFLATMSHEIRTPLIGVLGMVEVLARADLQAEQARQLGIVHQSAQSLLRIIGDILDFSKIEAGKLELEPVTVSLRELLSRVAGNYSAAAAAKGLALVLEYDEAIAPAHVVDPTRLSQVLGNWISNAIKFTADGAVTVRLRALGREGGRESLSISVADTGPGIRADQLARLFQPFTQADASTTRRYGGTGLGLAITRKLADLLGGAVEVDSAPGRGTTMTLSLALAIGEAADLRGDAVEGPDARMPERTLPTFEEARRDGTLVLLAEDHPVNRKVLTLQLNLAGFQVECAEDGAAALAKFRAGRYALVFTDLHMPGLDGRQLTAAIREHEGATGQPRTPVIALTANVLSGEAERCRAAGMDDYLSKPVTIGQLAAKLERWLPALPK